MRLKINKMEHFHYRNIGQIGHFFMNFHYARYEKVKKSVPPNIKNEASDHLKESSLLEGKKCYALDASCNAMIEMRTSNCDRELRLKIYITL